MRLTSYMSAVFNIKFLVHIYSELASAAFFILQIIQFLTEASALPFVDTNNGIITKLSKIIQSDD